MTNQPEPKVGGSPAGDPAMIEAVGLCKYYGSFAAVENVSFGVRRGEVVAFLGPNGAGKSTTIKMLLGMSRPTSGSGLLLGHPIDDERENREARRDVAYVAEDKQTYAYMTVGQMIVVTPAWRNLSPRALSSLSSRCNTLSPNSRSLSMATTRACGIAYSA